MKTALIIGANGQDASYLAEFLIKKGNYEVHGTIRRNSVPESQTTRIEDIYEKNYITLHYADLTDTISIQNVIKNIQPHEIYHLAAQSHVQISFELPQYTLDTNCSGTLAILEAVRNFSPHSKIYFAATSEMFGNCFDSDKFQRESTPMIPVSPYGCSKLYGYNLCNNYRNAYDMFISNGILFNHESPRRGINFVTNKIVLGAVKIYLQKQDKLILGNLDAHRDWGHAKDYVTAMWMMLQQEKSDNFVISTGETHSVRELVIKVFNYLQLDWEKYVEHDNKKYIRPEELHYLRGDCSKAKNILGWTPTITFDDMIEEMIHYWLKQLGN
jgi:GDPmannose 4,6-dehydratase